MSDIIFSIVGGLLVCGMGFFIIFALLALCGPSFFDPYVNSCTVRKDSIEKKPAFTKWRNFVIGGEEIETIILTPHDLGFVMRDDSDYDYNKRHRLPTTDSLFSEWNLAEWSKQNAARLPSGYVIELLPPESGPYIRDQYNDQPKGENLWLAMRVFCRDDPGGYSNVFSIFRDDDGKQLLWSSLRYLHHEISGRLWLFRLRKVALRV